MKLKKQVTVCGGAIFCVAVFSLYLMLDRVQHDPGRRQNGGNFPRVRMLSVCVCVCARRRNAKHAFLLKTKLIIIIKKARNSGLMSK